MNLWGFQPWKVFDFLLENSSMDIACPAIQSVGVASQWTAWSSTATASHQSAQQLQSCHSVLESGLQICKPACPCTGMREASKGKDATTFFCKTREMTSLLTFPRRQSSLRRAAAHYNCLRDVEKARTSPLHQPESHGLVPPFSEILLFLFVFFVFNFGVIPYSSARNIGFSYGNLV